MRDPHTTKLGKHQLSPQSLMMGYGYDPRLSEGSLKPPIFLTSTFVFDSCADGKRFFEGITGKRSGGPEGLVYGRFNGPDQEILEDRLALWEGAEEAAVFSTGMSAITTALLAHVRAGEMILHSGPLYAATEKLIDAVFGRLGVEFGNFPAGAPLADVRALIEASRAKRRIAVIYLESPANPTNELVDIAGIVRLRDELYADDAANKPLIMVDNTFLGPVFQQPIKNGADVSLYSLTKYVGGHSDLVAGGVVGSKTALQPIMALRNTIGTISDPHTSWMLLRSLETVALRMERAEQNARTVCEFLRAHPEDRARGLSRFSGTNEPAGAHLRRTLLRRRLDVLGAGERRRSRSVPHARQPAARETRRQPGRHREPRVAPRLDDALERAGRAPQTARHHRQSGARVDRHRERGRSRRRLRARARARVTSRKQPIDRPGSAPCPRTPST